MRFMKLTSKEMFWKYFWEQTKNPMDWNTFNKYISTSPDEAMHMLSYNGMKGVMEVIIKNWCTERFNEPFELPKAKNERGFDIRSVSGKYRIEVKTVWGSTNPSKNSSIVGFGNIESKQGYCTHILFYNAFNDPNSFYLFDHDDVYNKLHYTGGIAKKQIRYSPVFNTRRQKASKCYINSLEFQERRITL
jgi:hypothetical protein